jgi:hypothetical protein
MTTITFFVSLDSKAGQSAIAISKILSSDCPNPAAD